MGVLATKEKSKITPKKDKSKTSGKSSSQKSRSKSDFSTEGPDAIPGSSDASSSKSSVSKDIFSDGSDKSKCSRRRTTRTANGFANGTPTLQIERIPLANDITHESSDEVDEAYLHKEITSTCISCSERCSQRSQLVLEYGLDYEAHYSPPPYILSEIDAKKINFLSSKMAGKDSKKIIIEQMKWSFGLISAGILILVALIILFLCFEANERKSIPEHLQLTCMNGHDKCTVKTLDDKSTNSKNFRNDEDFSAEVDQVQLLLSKLEQLQKKTEAVGQQHSALQETVKQMIKTVDILKEASGPQTFRAVYVHDETKRKVHEEIAIYDADKLAIPDYALETSGGSVISTPDTKTFVLNTWLTFGGISLWNVERSPRNIIQASLLPGDCWAFQGSTGKIIIQLAMVIHITAVTMEHIPPAISLTRRIDSAPQTFSVFGLHDIDDSVEIHLGQYTYSETGPPRQTFDIEYKTSDRVHSFKAVKLWILSNHGNKEFTCVYRFRVHGQPTQDMHSTIS